MLPVLDPLLWYRKTWKNRTANFDTNAAGIYLHEGKEHIWYIMMYILYNYTLCMVMHVTCIRDSYMAEKNMYISYINPGKVRMQ